MSSYLKYRNFFWALAMVGPTLLSSCENNDKEAPNPNPTKPKQVNVVGKYTTKKVTVSKDPGVLVPLVKGTDLTAVFDSLLLYKKFKCGDKTGNAVIDLRKDNNIFINCKGVDNKVKRGTWSPNSDSTSVTLQLDAADNLPATNLVITNLNLEKDVFSGATKIRLTKPLLEVADPDRAKLVPADFSTLVDVDIELNVFKAPSPPDGTITDEQLVGNYRFGNVDPSAGRSLVVSDFVLKIGKCSGPIGGSLANATFELKANKDLYFSCKGTNPIKRGTWTLHAAQKTLSLNRDSGDPVTLTQIAVQELSFSGVVSISGQSYTVTFPQAN